MISFRDKFNLSTQRDCSMVYINNIGDEVTESLTKTYFRSSRTMVVYNKAALKTSPNVQETKTTTMQSFLHKVAY